MRTLILLALFAGSLWAVQPNEDWLTYYEKSGFTQTPRYAETIDFCKRLADASDMVHYTTFGKSPQGRDLPLLIVDKNGYADMEDVRRGTNVVFMIQAGIHSGEIDGKDAGLTLIRDMVIHGKHKELLEHVTILFIPIFSVDGHERFSAYNRVNQNGPEEMGWRVTAQNYNLNRDYLKADAPEMQAWLKLYTHWLPEFFADCHVTDGADYQYPITYKIDEHGVMNASLVEWVKNKYISTLRPYMNKDGFLVQDYVSFVKSHDPKSGMASWVSKPRLSDGYTALQNRPGLLIETHMFKDYKTRVSATYSMLKNTMVILNRDYQQLRSLVNEADVRTSHPDFLKESYTLRYKYSDDSTMINFAGYKYSKEKSSLTGGDWYRFSKDTVTWRVPFYNIFEPDVQVELPKAYVIPVEWTEVIKRMRLHGVKMQRLIAPQKLTVKTYHFFNEKWSQKPYENHHTLTCDLREEEEDKVFPAGSVVVKMNQRTAKIIAHILEPKAPDSYLFWGFFDSIFERKEYVESYVMEEYARFMLSSDPQLKKEFEEKKMADAEFAASPYKIRMWFYQKSPYWDKRIKAYPAGRIFDLSQIEDGMLE